MIRLRPSGADEVIIKRVRDWYEPGPGVFIAPQALFNPALLFTTGVNGTWYDPSDMMTLFQNAAGTTPVTAVEQPVGLMLDKSKGLVLGPERSVNGDFSNGTTGWTTASGATLVLDSTVIASGAKITSAGVGSFASLVVSGLVAGKTYAASIRLYLPSSNTVNSCATFSLVGQHDSGRRNIPEDSIQTVPYYFTATGTSVQLAVTMVNPSVAWSASGDVAYIDDLSVRELPGNHAFNSSGNSANFPVLSARYNLLTKTEDFSDSNVWTGPSVSINQKVAPDGTLTADKVTFAAGSQLFYKSGTNSTISAPNSTITGAIYVWSDVNTSVTFRVFAWGGSNFDSTETIIANQWNLLRKSVLIDGSTGNIGIAIISPDANTLYVWGADLRVSNDALNQPAYQRVNTSSDYDTVGFKPYLKFNGTNQWLQTNSIDFSYGDKMFVCAGVRKLSDAARGILAELSASPSTNFFNLEASGPSAGANFGSLLAGSAITSVSATTFTSPVTSVVTVQDDISKSTRETELLMRVNGVVPTLTYANATDAGTGNFGNYPLYIGARAGSSLWFNGRLHQLVVAGKQASASEVGQTEAFTNQKTGAY